MNDRPRQHRKIVRRAVLTRRIQAMHGFKVGILQMQFFYVLSHHGHELRLAARDIISQRHAGIIAGVDDEAAA